VSGLVSGRGVQGTALRPTVAPPTAGGGAMSRPVAVSRGRGAPGQGPRGREGSNGGVQVQAADGKVTGSRQGHGHPYGGGGAGRRVIRVEPALAEVPHRLGVAQSAVALRQAEIGGGALG